MSDVWYGEIDRGWTLFLDRDGVINRKLENDYVKRVEDFVFLSGVLSSLQILADVFGRIVVVTNQQGIGKGLMTEGALHGIHEYMLNKVHQHGGRIDAVYHCPGLEVDNPPCRKPNTGMALEAQRQFPQIDFTRSVMVGDSPSDMEFGQRLGMKCVRIGASDPVHEMCSGLSQFASLVNSSIN